MTFYLSYIVLISDFKLYNNHHCSNGVCKDPFVLGSPQCAALEAPHYSRVCSTVQSHCMTVMDHLHQTVVGGFLGHLAALLCIFHMQHCSLVKWSNFAIYLCKAQQCTSIALNSKLFNSIMSPKHIVSSPAHPKNVEKLMHFQPTRDMLVATAIDKNPHIKSRCQIQYPELMKVEPGSTLPQGDYRRCVWPITVDGVFIHPANRCDPRIWGAIYKESDKHDKHRNTTTYIHEVE
jgi:hypothetical protein